MNKRVGILALLVATAVSVFHPAVASAQRRDDYRQGYADRDNSYADRDYRNDRRDGNWDRDRQFRENQWREARERQLWRERQFRDRYYCRPGYRSPGVGFGFSWYGR